MSGDVAFEEPTYSFNEQATNILRVVVKIPGLRSSAVIRFEKFLPKMGREIDNGRAQVNFETRFVGVTTSSIVVTDDVLRVPHSRMRAGTLMCA
nr:unnamed protein product [Spirometra erinaceieuropaei]